MSNVKVLIIGLDGATWDLIKPWAEEGKLPTFKKLMGEGAWGELESTLPPLSPAAWTSVFTGVTPLKHNIWSFVKQKKDSYFIRPISSMDLKATPLWELLSHNGIRSVFLNIPFAYPPSRFNGIITTGLGTPSKNSDFSYPNNVKDEILNKFPNYNVDFNEEKILLSKDKSFIIDEISVTTKACIDVFKYFYEREKELSRVFSIVLRSLDVIQHYFWDKEEIIFKFYRQADEFLNWCIENKEDNDILLICSDHGFRGIKKKIYVNDWLIKEKFLKENIHQGMLAIKTLPFVETFYKLLVNLGLRDIIWKIKHAEHLDKLTKVFPSDFFSNVQRVCWEETDAYFLEGSAGIIQINLEGREARGAVPEKKYDEVREKVIRKLTELKDPELGDVVFEFIKKGEEIYGKSVECPDIVAYPKDGYMLSGGFSRSKQIFEEETERNGDHAIKGIICVYGGSIRIGTLKSIRVWDVPAIILASIGLPIPDHFDGKVPKGLFKEEFFEKRKKITSRMFGEKMKIRKIIKKRIKRRNE
jgi:predicted AlkP superfamily phosphohydrolase/phosphomutase